MMQDRCYAVFFNNNAGIEVNLTVLNYCEIDTTVAHDIHKNI